MLSEELARLEALARKDAVFSGVAVRRLLSELAFVTAELTALRAEQADLRARVAVLEAAEARGAAEALSRFPGW